MLEIVLMIYNAEVVPLVSVVNQSQYVKMIAAAAVPQETLRAQNV